jgi:predicted peroxiredoxin
MSETSRNLVVVGTHGPGDELSTVAFTVACGGMTKGLRVSMFLTGSGIDVVRKRAMDSVHVQPFEALGSLVKDFISRGGAVWACAPCVKSHGYTQEDLIDGVTITGAGPMHELIADGAATLSF